MCEKPSYNGCDLLNKTKVCTRCNEEKYLAEFSKDKRRAFGKHSFCIPCSREWNRERYPRRDREALRRADKRYREKNKDALKQRRFKESIGEYSNIYFRQCEHEGCGKIDVLRKEPVIKYCKSHNRVHLRGLSIHRYTERTCAKCGLIYKGRARSNTCNVCVKKNARATKNKYKRFRTDKKRSEYYGVYHEPRFMRTKVFRRDKYKCQECGKKTIKPDGTNHPDEYTLGHIVPMVHGGPTSYSNCQCECRDCNTKKSTKLYGQQTTIFMMIQSAVNQ